MARFIFDRTAGWGKEWERITIGHFTEGVVGSDGRVHGKLNSARRETVSVNLVSMAEAGIILRRPRGKQCFEYSINYEWNPEMKVPKRLKNLPEESESEQNRSGSRYSNRSGSRNATVPVGGPKEEEKEIPSEREYCASLTALASSVAGEEPLEDEGESLLALVNRTVSASRSRRAAHKQDGHQCRGAAGGFAPSEGAMRRIWIDLHVEHFPTIPVPALSVKAVHSVRGYAKEWNNRNPTLEFATDYLPWLFANWESVRRLVIHWMVQFPLHPEPFLLANAKMRPHIEAGWAERQRIDAVRALTPREQEIIEIKRKSGVSQATAEKMAKNREDGAADLKRAKETLANAKMLEETTRRQSAVAIATAIRIAAPPKPLNLSPEECREFEEVQEARDRDKLRASAAASLAARPQRNSLQPYGPIPERFPDWDDT